MQTSRVQITITFLAVVLGSLISASSCFAQVSIPVFVSRVLYPIPASIQTKMRGTSWHKEYACPDLKTLSYLELSYWGYDNKRHKGVMIVAYQLAPQIVKIFQQLYLHKFPIYSMKPMYEFFGDDERSMENNNTSSFNCRPVTGKKHKLSEHSYGRAIDINTRTNPYVKGNLVVPKNGRKFVDRSKVAKGKIAYGDFVYNTFKKAGWSWGGDWHDLQDYQHFEREQRGTLLHKLIS